MCTLLFISTPSLAQFSVECRKTKTRPLYLPIRLLSQSQATAKPKPKAK